MPKLFLVYIIIILTGCSYNHFKTAYFDLYKGDIPIILVVSHDGRNVFNFLPIRQDSTDNFNIKNDLNTQKIGKSIYDEVYKTFKHKPSLLINNIHRKYVDLNRHPKFAYESYRGEIIYQEYHKFLIQEVNRILEVFDKVYLFDIHGFAHDEIDIVLSTRNHTTVMQSDMANIFNSKNSIYNELARIGLNTQINNPFYGGFTVKNINKRNKDQNISAIQIELGNKIRFNKTTQQLFIKSFSNMIYKMAEI